MVFFTYYKPNIQVGDFVAEDHESIVVLNNPNLIIEEKIDGANSAIMMDNEGNPIIRNRSNILKKGYVKDTPAKKQFASIWNWFYDHKEQFIEINKYFDEPVGIYAEWCKALHGIVYDELDSYFVAYDIWLPNKQYYINTLEARNILNKCGFTTPRLLHEGILTQYSDLDILVKTKSQWSSSDEIEGLYLKLSDAKKVTHRFKFIHPGYTQGSKWNKEHIIKQNIKKVN